jgi:hypothetical protein
MIFLWRGKYKMPLPGRGIGDDLDGDVPSVDSYDYMSPPPNRDDYSSDRDYLDAVREYNKFSNRPVRIKTGKSKTLRRQYLEEKRHAGKRRRTRHKKLRRTRRK